MKCIGAVATDKGIIKTVNEDSACLKIAETSDGMTIAMAVVCDGMGGLSKGELASATVIRRFVKWFDEDLSENWDSLLLQDFGGQWNHIIREQNDLIKEYSKKQDEAIGTTVSGLLIIGDKYVIAHVGDSRIYEITNDVKQLTKDHSLMQREIEQGRLTEEEAENDPRRGVLLQCVGASKVVEPQILFGDIKKNTTFVLCTDGFRHVLDEKEMYRTLSPGSLGDVADIYRKENNLIDMIKSRNERDNITVVALKCM